jgi:probable F420-dependent oxidoreductase
MADAAPGRFVLGVGTSSQVIVENWNGVPFVEPYQRGRDLVDFLRVALTGERVAQDYDTFSVKGFRLSRVPAVMPGIFVAALREGMLRLAGRRSDGIIINWLTASDVTQVVTTAGGGRQEDLDVVCRIPVCLIEDKDAAREAMRFAINYQLNIPVYAAFQEWLGRGDALGPMWTSWREGDRKGALRLIPEVVIDDLVVHGGPEECAEHLRRFVAAGVTCPAVALMPVPGEDWTDSARRLARAWYAQA